MEFMIFGIIVVSVPAWRSTFIQVSTVFSPMFNKSKLKASESFAGGACTGGLACTTGTGRPCTTGTGRPCTIGTGRPCTIGTGRPCTTGLACATDWAVVVDSGEVMSPAGIGEDDIEVKRFQLYIPL